MYRRNWHRQVFLLLYTAHTAIPPSLLDLFNFLLVSPCCHFWKAPLTPNAYRDRSEPGVNDCQNVFCSTKRLLVSVQRVYKAYYYFAGEPCCRVTLP